MTTDPRRPRRRLHQTPKHRSRPGGIGSGIRRGGKRSRPSWKARQDADASRFLHCKTRPELEGSRFRTSQVPKKPGQAWTTWDQSDKSSLYMRRDTEPQSNGAGLRCQASSARMPKPQDGVEDRWFFFSVTARWWFPVSARVKPREQRVKKSWSSSTGWFYWVSGYCPSSRSPCLGGEQLGVEETPGKEGLFLFLSWRLGLLSPSPHCLRQWMLPRPDPFRRGQHVGGRWPFWGHFML